ncbi:uncharacterized protein LOC135376381 [Ornithodoros turicata]|uniref:uncharacterized protein LOC135376381 n=1 Tax=Ornithodoros turicata TaxID=34597 RepID=UPI0031392791
MAFILEFTDDIRHIPGTSNYAADALSRLDIAAVSTQPSRASVDFDAIALAQATDTKLHALRDQPSGSLKFAQSPLPSTTTLHWCDISTGSPRPFVPSEFRRCVFDSLRNLSHPGIRASQKLIQERYIWPGINRDVRRWTRSCLFCQRSKVHRHTVSPPGLFLTPDVRFDRVHTDIVGPLPPVHSKRYLLTYRPLHSLAGSHTTRRHNCRVRSLSPPLWLDFSVWRPVFHNNRPRPTIGLPPLQGALPPARHRAHTYHRLPPRRQWYIERLHRQLKAALCVANDTRPWLDRLPLVLLGTRSSLKTDLRCSSADLVYGSPLRLPGAFFTPVDSSAVPDPSSYLDRLRSIFRDMVATPPRTPRRSRTIFCSPDLDTATHVFVRRDTLRAPLQPPYDGPFKVLHRADKYVEVQLPRGPDTITLDRLKPAHLADIDAPLPPTTHLPSPAALPIAASGHRRARPPTRHVRWTSPLVQPSTTRTTGQSLRCRGEPL